MVIDELVVVLGLDSRQFTQEQRDAVDTFRRTQEQFDRSGKAMEATSAKVADSFGIIRKGAMGIIGAFVGGEIAGFIEHVVTMDAATGRWAKTIGTNVENLGIWQGMIRQVGGSAEDATSALSGLQDQLDRHRQGQMLNPALNFLIGQTPGASRLSSPDQLLRAIGAHVRSEVASGRHTAGYEATLLRQAGINENMINLLLNNDIGKIEQEAKKVGGATKETSDPAALLTQRFSLLTQAMERLAASTIPFIDLLTTPLKDLTWDKVKKAFGGGVTVDEGSVADQTINIGKRLFNQPLNAAHAGTLPSATAGTGRADPGDREGWIRSLAQSLGIDPQTAVRVARSEGFKDYTGDHGTSFGDFQLHVTPGGRGGAVGDAFKKQTGMDPADPKNERAMDEFALKWAATHGWGDFHGAARAGIGQWQGIGARGGAAARVSNTRSSSSTSTTTVHVAKAEINTKATDASGIMSDLVHGTVKYGLVTAPANTGLT